MWKRKRPISTRRARELRVGIEAARLALHHYKAGEVTATAGLALAAIRGSTAIDAAFRRTFIAGKYRR